jgi:hypothetical protein
VKFGSKVTLLNDGPDAPFGGRGFRRADPQSTGLVMQFQVTVPLAAPDTTTLPAAMIMPNDVPAAPPPVRTRPLGLLELMAIPQALPHRRSRGQRDDAAVPDRPARPTQPPEGHGGMM